MKMNCISKCCHIDNTNESSYFWKGAKLAWPSSTSFELKLLTEWLRNLSHVSPFSILPLSQPVFPRHPQPHHSIKCYNLNPRLEINPFFVISTSKVILQMRSTAKTLKIFTLNLNSGIFLQKILTNSFPVHCNQCLRLGRQKIHWDGKYNTL